MHDKEQHCIIPRTHKIPQPRTNQKVSGSRARARLLPFLEKMTEQKQKIVSKNGRSNDR